MRPKQHFKEQWLRIFQNDDKEIVGSRCPMNSKQDKYILTQAKDSKTAENKIQREKF